MNSIPMVGDKMGQTQNSDREKLIFVLKYAFPEMDELLPLRFNLLNTVKFNQPIGRRILSTTMGYTERVVRRECDILKDNHLIDYYPDGMRITQKGEDVLASLTDIFYQVNGINELEVEISEKLKIKKVIVGSVGLHDAHVSLNEIGYEAAKYLSTLINSKSIIGLTGGSSIEKVITGYKAEWTQFDHNDIMVVPARGGLGNKNEYQANTLAEILSNKLGAKYQMLYTQDNLSKATIEELKNEPNIKRILEYIDKLDVLLFGIGRADVMATRRVLDADEIEGILEKGAVAESFGYYFNKDGEIVHEISTIGIDLDKFKALKDVIAVAGGIDKAESIIAISKLNPNLVLVTDEQTAKKINELL
ncbi:sugar-binding transcriptional regulator [Fusibacter ferrireducens]|nr:sugar-binding domain-containing protein [Fusibacter ferrireducens]